MGRVLIMLFYSFIVLWSVGCGAGETSESILSKSNKHNLTISKCKNLYGNYTQSQWANEMGYGKDKPLVTACYQALVAGPTIGIDGQFYIDAYNQGTYDLIEGSMNNQNSKIASDTDTILSMGFEKCNQLFSEFDSQEMFDFAIIMTKESLKEEISEDDRYDYKMSAMMIAHCRKVLYDE